jgi:hypothetical protein
LILLGGAIVGNMLDAPVFARKNAIEQFIDLSVGINHKRDSPAVSGSIQSASRSNRTDTPRQISRGSCCDVTPTGVFSISLPFKFLRPHSSSSWIRSKYGTANASCDDVKMLSKGCEPDRQKEGEFREITS